VRLDELRGLIVSIQPPAGSALDDPTIVAAMAVCAIDNGALGVRIEGARRIAAVRARLPRAPIVGLIKNAVAGYEPYITATMSDVEHVLEAGASIVAADATNRRRSDASTFSDAVDLIRRRGALSFADCSELADACAARDAGADLLGTTLCGYTDVTRGTPLPALDLVRSIAALGGFTVCEGGVSSPAQAADAFAAGADAVVVGTALTNLDVLVRRYAEAVSGSRHT
jgi:N-acylglucosamine-6-phosphate 2-epimerase